MFTTKNRNQRWGSSSLSCFSPSPCSAPPGLLWKHWEVELGGLAGRVSVPGNAQENFLTAALQVKPCNFIILK